MLVVRENNTNHRETPRSKRSQGDVYRVSKDPEYEAHNTSPDLGQGLDLGVLTSWYMKHYIYI